MRLLVALPLAVAAFGGSYAALAVPPGVSSTPRIVFAFVDSDAHTFSEEERAEISRIGTGAVEELARILPGTPPRIEVTVQAGPQVVPETGEGGGATAPGQIIWNVDPDARGGVLEIARARLRVTLFHEVHHLVRGWTMSGGTAGSRMIDAAVSEGMATAFERDAGGADPLWSHYPADEVDRWVDELIEVRGGLSEYGTWMFQHTDGRRWIGYRAGTYLTDRAMAACGCSAADLVTTPTDEVLSLAGRRGRP